MIAIKSKTEIDAQRARLAPWLWPVRCAMAACHIISLYAAFRGAQIAPPVIAGFVHGSGWPPASSEALVTPLVAALIAGLAVSVFALIAYPLLHGVNYIGRTFVANPYWRTETLDADGVFEAMYLAKSSRAAENYRATVARQREFVNDDLCWMRKLAGKDHAKAIETKQKADQEAMRKHLYCKQDAQ